MAIGCFFLDSILLIFNVFDIQNLYLDWVIISVSALDSLVMNHSLIWNQIVTGNTFIKELPWIENRYSVKSTGKFRELPRND